MLNFQQTEELVIALLIDGDNVSSEYVNAIEKELAIIGNVTHKRLYYTFNGNIPGDWRNVCNAHAFTLRQVLPYLNSNNNTIKNVADSALIIDAMDILYSNNVNCVCIVASDSDYTTITKRLRESGIRVLGMGEKKTPAAFVNACDEFKYLEVLKEMHGASSDSTDTSGEAEASIPDKKEIEDFIVQNLIQAGTKLDAGELKKRIVNKWPNFDQRNYGAKAMRQFFNVKKFKVIQEDGGNINVDLLKR